MLGVSVVEAVEEGDAVEVRLALAEALRCQMYLMSRLERDLLCYLEYRFRWVTLSGF